MKPNGLRIRRNPPTIQGFLTRGAKASDDAQGQGSGDPGQDPSSSENAKSSIGQALLDALKGLLANQPTLAGTKVQPRSADDRQGDANQPDPGEGGDQRDRQQGKDTAQKNPQGTANGAGDQQAGDKELKKSTPLTVKPSAQSCSVAIHEFERSTPHGCECRGGNGNDCHWQCLAASHCRGERCGAGKCPCTLPVLRSAIFPARRQRKAVSTEK